VSFPASKSLFAKGRAHFAWNGRDAIGPSEPFHLDQPRSFRWTGCYSPIWRATVSEILHLHLHFCWPCYCYRRRIEAVPAPIYSCLSVKTFLSALPSSNTSHQFFLPTNHHKSFNTITSSSPHTTHIHNHQNTSPRCTDPAPST
jgi:hypothetical protein